MIRRSDRAEIYILSLDTFMLMAVLGITLGILFIVVNPSLNFEEKGIKDLIKSNISSEEIISFVDNFFDDDNTVDLNFSESDFIDSGYFDSSSNFKYLMRLPRNYFIVGQIRKTKKGYSFIKILFTQKDSKSDSYQIGIQVKNSETNNYIVEKDENKKQFNEIVKEELKYWTTLNRVLEKTDQDQ